jgi:death-on-curing family protein
MSSAGNTPPKISDSRIDQEETRWETLLGDGGLPFDRTAISLHEVLQAHFMLIRFFNDVGEGIGGVGPKDPNLLVSALARQFAEFAGKARYDSPLDKVASLLYGLVKNHPFHDANKRTAFLTAMLHLQKVNRTPTATDQEYEDFVVDIATDTLDRYARRGVQTSDQDGKISVISDFLRRKTRAIDRQNKAVTFNELKTILSNFGFDMLNPQNNRIDIVRVIDGQRICKIGFPAWSKEVSHHDIAIVREAANLDVANGYDAQAFFNGAETPLELIKKYKTPLRNLAFR